MLQPGFDTLSTGLALEREEISHVSLVPPMLARLLEAERGPGPVLRHALIGGGPLSPALAQRARKRGWPLCVSYGMSETGSQLATDCGPRAGLRSGQVGRPLQGFELDINGCEKAPRRLRVRGPALMLGYANPTRKPGDGLSDGWFETGDLVCREADGGLRLIGRADEVLVSGGVNVHPQQVEARLATLAGIEELAVTALPDPIWGDLLVAVYRGTASPQVLAELSRDLLPSAQRPRQWLAVSRLPYLGPDKLDRRRLRELAAIQLALSKSR